MSMQLRRGGNMKKISLNQVLEAFWQLQENEGKKFTLLGIGPMSKRVIKAAFELGKEKDFPLMFIASRNQIDSQSLGGGYVMGWDQEAFVKALQRTAAEVGFDGLLYICRDHGGPWQRDNERESKLPLGEAMALAKRSFIDDVASGFNVLHLDPTKDPHVTGGPELDVVIERVIELLSYVEETIRRKNLTIEMPLAYEIGTEETAGGLIDVEAFEYFLKRITRELEKRKLPHPAFIVGQTGTLVKMARNVGRVNPEAAQSLAAAAKKYKIGFKEHNADYLPDEVLRMHPKLGITAANVAPEYGAAETMGYLKLADMEVKALGRQKADDVTVPTFSNFAAVLKEMVLISGRWRKWLPKEKVGYSISELENDPALLEEMVVACGHYTFETERLKRAEQKLFANIRKFYPEVDPEALIIDSIKKAISRYVDAFNLEGTTTMLCKTVESTKNLSRYRGGPWCSV